MVMTQYDTNRQGATMYPLHTGSILLEIATSQRNEQIANGAHRRRVALASATARPSKGTPKHPWWWGLASRSHRPA
jgi:hypothetical protein